MPDAVDVAGGVVDVAVDRKVRVRIVVPSVGRIRNEELRLIADLRPSGDRTLIVAQGRSAGLSGRLHRSGVRAGIAVPGMSRVTGRNAVPRPTVVKSRGSDCHAILRGRRLPHPNTRQTKVLMVRLEQGS
jgi:hypothetical protein